MRHLRRVVLRQEEAAKTDGQLLTSFIEQRDEAAFEALVRRHGPMVWGVCRRVVGNHHDAEDALQATLLVLARKAPSVRPRERVAGWLHGVALRTAMRAKAMTAKRRGREKQVTQMSEPEAANPDPWRDLQPLLDQALNGLPENYRLAILRCDLEGKAIKEAAQQLGWPQGTLAGRLARGRKLLARRLVSRGVVLSAGALAAVLSQHVASAAVPTSLMSSTVKAAAMIAAGQAAIAGVVPAPVASLMEGVIKSMMLTKLSKAVAGLVVLSVLAFGGGLLTDGTAAGQQTRGGKDGDKPAVGQSAPLEQDAVRVNPDFPVKATDGERIAVESDPAQSDKPAAKDVLTDVEEEPTGKLLFGTSPRLNGEEKKLQGTWRLVSGGYGRHPQVPGVAAGQGILKTTDITIDGKDWIGWMRDGRKHKVAFRVDASETLDVKDYGFSSGLEALGLRPAAVKAPKRIDIKEVGGDYAHGIYGLSGDELVIRLLPSGKQGRPTRFAMTGEDGVLLLYKRVRPEEEKDRGEGPEKDGSDEVSWSPDVPAARKQAPRREYLIMSRLLEAGADQPKEVLRLPRATVDEGQLVPISIIDVPQRLLEKVLLDEKIKIGLFLDVRVRRLGGNKVRLIVSFQKNEVEESSVSGVHVLGNSVQAVQDVELHKPVKMVFERDAEGSARRWVELTVDEVPVDEQAIPAPTSSRRRQKEGTK
jgi:RNA polymerase sigma factor (sigma-70 family)